jgi:hypothetical protein
MSNEKWLVEETTLQGETFTYEYDSYPEANAAFIDLREGTSVLKIKKKPQGKLIVEG